MSITPTPARLRAALVAALAISALGAGASSASAAQTLSISDTNVQEGSHGASGTATFTITDHYDLGEAPSYDYKVQTSSVEATAGDDYVETTDSGGYTGLVPCDKAAGCSHESTFTVPVVGDDTPEDNEKFLAYFSSSLPIENSMVYATIMDDDQANAGATPSGPSGPSTGSSQPIVTDPPAPAHGGSTSTSGPTTTTGGPGTQAADDLAPDFSMDFLGMRKSARVRLTCPDDEISCSGRLFIRSDLTHNVGIKRFRLDGGESRVVSVRLSRSARRKLRRAGTFFMRAVAYDAAANRTVRESWLQI